MKRQFIPQQHQAGRNHPDRLAQQAQERQRARAALNWALAQLDEEDRAAFEQAPASPAGEVALGRALALMTPAQRRLVRSWWERL